MTPAVREEYTVAARAYGYDTTGIDEEGLALVHTIRFRRLYWWISDTGDAECQRLLEPVASFQAAEQAGLLRKGAGAALDRLEWSVPFVAVPWTAPWWVALLHPAAPCPFQHPENRAGWENGRATTERQPKAAAAFREYLTACGAYLHRIGFDLEDIPQPSDEAAG
jgi:hypothetical protein